MSLNMSLKPVIRYSPKPMSEYKLWRPDTPTEYKKGSGNLDSGTIQFTLKAHEPATWNLAYLSHPFERGNPPKDLTLYVWCSHFVRTNIHTGELTRKHSDVLEIPDDHVYPQLLKPAPQFIKWLDDNQELLLRSDIYEAYGDRWLDLIRKRAFKCATHDEPDEQQIRSVAEARKLLQAFRVTR